MKLLLLFLLGAAACHGRRTTDQAPSRDTTAVAAPRGTLDGHAGASSTIESDEIEKRHPTRFADLLQGQPGVQVTQQGNGVSVRIRGAGTVYGSGEPLYVLDGVILGNGATESLLGLAASDIERIQVLRDAGTTAIYGSRGANGVIIVTTKRERTRGG
ncbi:MAG TPA: TonB-dependent receptor plug domain-containing protein [Gemmatimonadaceae bacterium]|nr:TonB-dependent receptor plug domain-containing protein [Gemmatimonadaceae bacterium]